MGSGRFIFTSFSKSWLLLVFRWSCWAQARYSQCQCHSWPRIVWSWSPGNRQTPSPVWASLVSCLTMIRGKERHQVLFLQYPQCQGRVLSPCRCPPPAPASPGWPPRSGDGRGQAPASSAPLAARWPRYGFRKTDATDINQKITFSYFFQAASEN